MDHLPHILFLDHTASLGGSQLALLRLLQQIYRGHHFNLSVLLFSDGPLRTRIEACGIEVAVLPLSSAVLHASRYDVGKTLLPLRHCGETTRYILRLAQVIRRSGADVVHTNTLKSNLIGGIAALLAQKKVIWHVHDRMAGDYLPAPVMHTFRYLARVLPSYVIANSQTTRKLLLGDSPRPHRVIYPGITMRAAPVTAQARSGCRGGSVIGLVGRISPTKGQDVLLRAIPHILGRFPGTSFRIIGGALFNDADYEKKMRALAAELGIDDSVLFTGFIDDVQREIADLDILVAPSTIAESFGQVIVEGMAAEKPVVATGIGGALEIVTDGETGCLVPPGDSLKLADVICSLLEHPEEAGQMGRRGRKSVANRFTIEQTGREVEQVYRHLLGQGTTVPVTYSDTSRQNVSLKCPPAPDHR